MIPITITNTDAQSNQQLDTANSDWTQSRQTESEEPSDPKVEGTDDNQHAGVVLLPQSSCCSTGSASTQDYSADCSSLDSESDRDSDWMQSKQAESEESNVPEVAGSDLLPESSYYTTDSVNLGKNASSGEGYSTDCSACSDQTSDPSVIGCAGSYQKQKLIMALTWNLLDLKYTSTDMESSSRQGGSSLGDEAAEPDKTGSTTAKRRHSTGPKTNNNHEATISTSAAVAPGRSSSNKQNRRHHSSIHHHRRRPQPRPPCT